MRGDLGGIELAAGLVGVGVDEVDGDERQLSLPSTLLGS